MIPNFSSTIITQEREDEGETSTLQFWDVSQDRERWNESTLLKGVRTNLYTLKKDNDKGDISYEDGPNRTQNEGSLETVLTFRELLWKGTGRVIFDVSLGKPKGIVNSDEIHKRVR